MKNFKKSFKHLYRNNKYTIIVLGIFLVLLVLAFASYNLIFPNLGKPVYGNRLNGIENVKISKDELKELGKELEKKDYVTSATVSVTGRIIKPIITVKKGTKPEDAKKLTEVLLKYFEEEYVEFYDMEIFIKNEEKESGYPIIGYKSRNAKTFTYSNAK